MAGRRVGKTSFDMPSDKELVATRVFDAPRQVIWDAHTRPEHVTQWMLGPENYTMPVCEMQLRAGGRWHYVWRGPNETEMSMHGVYREVDPPERIVNTESWGGTFPETLNSTEFSEQNGRTTLTTHVLYPSKQARDAAIGTGMLEGWSQSYDRLDRYLPQLMGAGAAHP